MLETLCNEAYIFIVTDMFWRLCLGCLATMNRNRTSNKYYQGPVPRLFSKGVSLALVQSGGSTGTVCTLSCLMTDVNLLCK